MINQPNQTHQKSNILPNNLTAYFSGSCFSDSSFSGSYLPSDVTLLIDTVPIDSIDNQAVRDKEHLIQTQQRHYSEMLTLEKSVSPHHAQLYEQALQQGKQRMANEIASLATSLTRIFANAVTAKTPLILVSLVRAGLPIGVLLQRIFNNPNLPYHLPTRHYGISIIRDRGLDEVALQQIFDAHPNSPLIFVDGWTGKGAIYGELERSLQPFSAADAPHHAQIFHQGMQVIPLLTLADPAGVAWLSASNEDWLMPASLLNSTVSGLISRTLYTPPHEGRHRCVLYQYLADEDKSLAFIEQIIALIPQANATILTPQLTPRFSTEPVILAIAQQYDIHNFNRIKPTIAEATRAVLRRDPECVVLQSADHPDTALLRHLCAQKNIPVRVSATIRPYQAITVIKKHSSD